jgi:hypothetical protein
MEDKKFCLVAFDPSIIIKIKSRETEQLHDDEKGEGLTSSDAKTAADKVA